MSINSLLNVVIVVPWNKCGDGTGLGAGGERPVTTLVAAVMEIVVNINFWIRPAWPSLPVSDVISGRPIVTVSSVFKKFVRRPRPSSFVSPVSCQSSSLVVPDTT